MKTGKSESVPPFSILGLKPADTPDYMTGMWVACITWAIGVEEILDAFRSDTGNVWKPSNIPLERMIDQASGAEEAFIKQFVEWVNVKIWGPIDGRGGGAES